MKTQRHDAPEQQVYHRQIVAPEGPVSDVELVYYVSWPEACAALTALLPDADLAAGYWGRVIDPRTNVTCYRDALCLD